MPVIGIDLGTTYSCVGVWQENHVHIIPDNYGRLSSPSRVTFLGPEWLVAGTSHIWYTYNPQDTIYDVKRIIGRKSDDPNIQQNLKHWSFKVIDDDNKPKIQGRFKNETKNFHPEEISSIVLGMMKQTAENFLKVSVHDAVISVPAYFNDSQRQATKDAAAIAGLNVIRLINEPTAAVLAYGLNKVFVDERNVVIFDLGGGTLDVSVITISGGTTYTVRSTAGNTYLGGEDFINRLMNYLVDDIMHKYQQDIRQDLRALRRLRNAAEIAKWDLSSNMTTKIKLNALYDTINYRTIVTREKFEELNADLFNDTLRTVEKALHRAKLDKSSIHDVILTGGSTRVPKIQNILEDFFCGIKLNISMNTKEAVATGAAILGAILSGAENNMLQGIKVEEVAALPIAIESAGCVMAIFNHNVKLSWKQIQTFTTSSDNQTNMSIQVYEGERGLTKKNNLLGSFDIMGLQSVPRGVPRVKVIFSIDLNGILNVSAENMTIDCRHNIYTKLKVEKDNGRLLQNEIDSMNNDITMYKKEYNQRKMKMNARYNLESYMINIKYMLEDICDDVLNKQEKLLVSKMYDEVNQWLKTNFEAKIEDYEQKLEEIETACLVIIKKVKNEMVKSLQQQRQTDEDVNWYKSDETDDNDELKDETTRTNAEDLAWILSTRQEAIAAEYLQQKKTEGASGGNHSDDLLHGRGFACLLNKMDQMRERGLQRNNVGADREADS